MARLSGAALVLGAGIALIGGPSPAHASAGGYLWVYGSDGTRNTGLQMAAGTSPAITALSPTGAIVAFQGANGDLWTYNDVSDVGTDEGVAMADGTSPDITQTSTTWEAGFVGANGDLWTFASASGKASDTSAKLTAGTSPTMTTDSAGTVDFAFNGPTSTGSHVIFQGPVSASGFTNTGQGPAEASPAITNLSAGGYQVLYAAGTTIGLYTMSQAGSSSATDLSHTVYPGSSPAALSVTKSWWCAYQAQNHHLGIYDENTKGSIDTNQLVAGSSSPAIAGGNDPIIAYANTNGDLDTYTYTGNTNTDTGYPVSAGSSPSIVSTSKGFEAAFQSPTAPAAATPPAGGTTTASPSTTTVPVAVTTTPVTQTTPVAPTSSSHRRRLAVRVSFAWTWNRARSTLVRVTLVRRYTKRERTKVHGRTTTRTVTVRTVIPKGTAARVSCRGRHCPVIPVPSARKKGAKVPLSRQLAAADRRRFASGDVMTITLTAPGYLSERITARIQNGKQPRLSVSR